MRTTSLLVLLLAGCSLDFDALERGRGDGDGDGGTGIDAHVERDGGGRDAATRDAAIVVDAQRADTGEDATTQLDAAVVVDAYAGDTFVPSPDAHVGCATLDCNNPECLGRSCDDGHVCTSNDVCTAAGACAGTAVTCAPNECATMVCTEPGGCHASAAIADGTLCTGGRCCFGHCSGLRDSGNCGGCGLGCDEESCTASGVATCVCETNAGCPLGQTCSGGVCHCTSGTQCAAGQTCVSNHCTY